MASKEVKVLGIDMGYANFAWCVLSSNQLDQPLAWNVERILRGKRITRNDIFHAIMAWCDRNQDMLNSVDHIVLEEQLQKRFISANAALRGRFHDKNTEVVSASVVAKLFSMTKRQCNNKKQRAIEICRGFNFQFPRVRKGQKLDDMADAALMAVWKMCKLGFIDEEELHQMVRETYYPGK